MLTSQDLKQIKDVVEEVVERVIDEKLDEKIKFLPTRDEFEKRIKFLPTRDEFEDLEKKIDLLPTTDVFLTNMAEVMGELKDMRESHELLSFRVSNHSDDIAALQDLHPNNKHVVAN